MEQSWSFDIFVAPGFVATEFAGIVDVLRLTNRVSTKPVFNWRFLSARGGPVDSSSAATIMTETVPTRPDADYLVALGNTDPAHPDLSLGPTLARYTTRQSRIILLAEAASRYIAETGNKTGRHTTHWENRAVLMEKHGLFETQAALAVDSGAIITGAGMGATFDLTLSIASQHMPSAIMMTVADILLHERIRHHNTLQPFSGNKVSATGDAAIDAAIALMQEHIEFPLSISQIAIKTRLSKRSLERRFARLLRATPNGYYRSIRLSKANNLLLNTDMRINEIGLACGFPSGFTTIYREAFAMTPHAARKKSRHKP